MAYTRFVPSIRLCSKTGRDILDTSTKSRHQFCMDCKSSARYCQTTPRLVTHVAPLSGQTFHQRTSRSSKPSKTLRVELCQTHLNLITSPLQWRNLSGSLLRIFYFIMTRLWPTSAYTGWHLTILLVNFVIVPQFMVVRPATVTLCTLQRLDKDHSSLEAQKFVTHWTLIWKNINR